MMMSPSDCVFCDIESDTTVFRSRLYSIIRDAFPVTHLHTLIIPRRHVASYFDLTDEEQGELAKLLNGQRQSIIDLDQTITGFNIGINVGEDAGQTVFHCHVHLIPRRKGDVAEPRGGVRGVIPGKQGYR
jgi:diadenosine tetraphosphate (Ap4A) HIT family hydrolase